MKVGNFTRHGTDFGSRLRQKVLREGFQKWDPLPPSPFLNKNKHSLQNGGQEMGSVANVFTLRFEILRCSKEWNLARVEKLKT